MIDFTLQILERRIAETAAWCRPRASLADPMKSLRSEQLAPPADIWDDGPSHPLETFNARFLAQAVARHGRVEDICKKRSEMLQEPRLAPNSPSPKDGQIFIVDVSQSMNDGLAEWHTDGFFDVFNVPPWDTWLAYIVETKPNPPPVGGGHLDFMEFLLFWAPAKFVPLAEAGRGCNAEACILRANDNAFDYGKSFAIRQLRAAGIL